MLVSRIEEFIISTAGNGSNSDKTENFGLGYITSSNTSCKGEGENSLHGGREGVFILGGS